MNVGRYDKARKDFDVECEEHSFDRVEGWPIFLRGMSWADYNPQPHVVMKSDVRFLAKELDLDLANCVTLLLNLNIEIFDDTSDDTIVASILNPEAFEEDKIKAGKYESERCVAWNKANEILLALDMKKDEE